MAVIIPPWLKAPDLAADYTRGLQIGTQVAEAQARISAENTRTAMESQARQQTLQQEHLTQQTRLATETAYKKTQLQLESQRLSEVAKVNAQKTQDAAMALADRQGLYSDLQGGMDPVQAHLRHPRASSVVNVETAQRMAMDLGDQRLALSKQKFEEQKRKDEEKQARMEKIGETSIKEPVRDAKGKIVAGAEKTTRTDIYGRRENGTPPSTTSTSKVLDKATATQLLKAAGGDKEKARAKARELGYSW